MRPAGPPCPTCGGRGRLASGAQLRKIRLKKGLTLEAMGLAVGTSAGALSEIERDKAGRLATARLLAAYEAADKQT